MKKHLLIVVAAAALGLSGSCFAAQGGSRGTIHLPAFARNRKDCDWWPTLCADVWNHKNYQGYYTGHDEPALGFYSTMPGSGNSVTYFVTLPTEPPVPVAQNGSGGTDDFQVRPAFQFLMALCDTQSAPEYTHTCVPDSDTNVFDNPSPMSPQYIGHHPGTAALEVQFYPPGWAYSSCDSALWCAALTIDSLNVSYVTGQFNNPACLDTVGDEPVNFSYITQDGIPLFPPNPLGIAFGISNFDLNQLLLMNPGDSLIVSMQDTSAGLKVEIRDLTTGQTGFMTASPINGFAQVVYNPQASSCQEQPYAFHPMYSTSTVHTRVPWAAHSVNVAYVDEIGHFEYCSAVDSQGRCITDFGEKPDADDTPCLIPGTDSFPPPPFIQIGGCIGEDLDFDGVSYRLDWPGTNANPDTDALLHPTPVRFTSALFTPTGGSGLRNYSSVGFETDMPAIETQQTPACNMLTGTDCLNPPTGAIFYPIFTTRNVSLSGSTECVWQFGGRYIPGTSNIFGGNSTTEYGSHPIGLEYPQPAPYYSITLFEDFRRILSSNPCATNTAALRHGRR